MQDALSFAAGVSECEVETKLSRSYTRLPLQARRLAVRLAAEALARCGFEPRYALSGGAADANVFNERGLPASTSPTAWPRFTPPTSTSPSPISRRWSR